MYSGHRLNMELDLQSLFGLHVLHLYSLAETPQTLPPPFGLIYVQYKGRYWSAKTTHDIYFWPHDIFASAINAALGLVVRDN